MRLFALPRSVRLHKGLLSGLILGAMLLFSGVVQAEPSSQPQPVYPEGPPPGIAVQQTQPDTNAAAESDADPAGAPQDDAASSEASAPPSPPKPQIVVDVAKDQQHMTVFVDGVERYSWPVSTGIAGYSTPSGSYQVSSMNEIWYSKQWDNAPMPHAVFFTKRGHAIHGTNEVKRLGTAASHGCVRLSPKNAKTLYTLVKETGMENVKVVLSGETPGGELQVASTQGDEGGVQGWTYPNYQWDNRWNDRRWKRRWRAQPYGVGPQGYNQPRYKQPRGQQQQAASSARTATRLGAQ